MRKSLVAVAAVCISLFAFLPSAQASVEECDYSKTYNDPKTIYVSRDGSAQFNCDGVDDEIEINQALQKLKASNGAYDSVFLKSGTYVISQPVKTVTNTILEGDKDAILKLKDQANWKVNVPMIAGEAVSHIDNVEIKCFEVDVNYAGNYSDDAYACMAGTLSCAKDDYACCEAYSPYRTTGKGYYNVAGFDYGNDYSIHDMYLHDGLGDGLNVMHSTGVKFYDNVVYKMGHEGAYVKYSSGFEGYRNTITNRTNSGLRADDTNNVSFYDNDIQAFDHWSAGGPGIEIVKNDRFIIQMNDIQIFNNYIHGTYGPGIWITASGTTYGEADLAANIHHNIFSGVGINPSINWTAGIMTSGFYNLTIENNVFDRAYNGALIISNAVNVAPSGSGYDTVLRNNIIFGTQPRRDTTEGGYGVTNLLSSTHTVESDNNCYFGNYAGDFSGTVTSAEDVFADPLFANAASGDYHLLSTAGRFDPATGGWANDTQDSPCIDAGSAASDYSFEPDYNGTRINIGRYGNTAEASKSQALIPTYILEVTGGTGSGVYPAGAVVDIVAAAPSEGKIFYKWIGDISNVADIFAPSTTMIMPDGGANISASYKDVYYSLTVTGGTGSGDYVFGQSVAITAGAAPSGKIFDKWTGDVSYVADVYSASTLVTMPTMGIAVIATYKDAYYTLNVTNGTGSGSYITGQLVPIAANAPATGKVFDRWTGDTAYVSDIYATSALVTMPAQAVNLTATYKSVYYLTVTYGNGDGYYASGDKVTITANAPAFGKVFAKWIGDTSYVSSIYSSVATVTMPAKAITLTATYKTAPKYYLTVNYGSGDGSYFPGAIVTIKASNPPTGKVFDKWIGDTAYVTNIYSATASFTMPAKAASVTATYRAK